MRIEILRGEELTSIDVDSYDRLLEHRPDGARYLQMHGPDGDAGILFTDPNEMAAFWNMVPVGNATFEDPQPA